MTNCGFNLSEVNLNLNIFLWKLMSIFSRAISTFVSTLFYAHWTSKSITINISIFSASSVQRMLRVLLLILLLRHIFTYPRVRFVCLWDLNFFPFLFVRTMIRLIKPQIRLIRSPIRLIRPLVRLIRPPIRLITQVCIVQQTSKVYVTKPLHFQNWKISYIMKFWSSYHW